MSRRCLLAVVAALAGLAAGTASAAPAPAWQVAATRADVVPADVLHAAARIRIAVVDTGADLTAPDLAAKLPAGYDTRTHGGDVRDVNGHGTFVASLVAEFGGDASLLVVKAGGANGTFSDAQEAAGIVYAVAHGARILNLSIGGLSTSAVERRAIDYAVAHGVLVVAAAGNEHALGNPSEYPAALLAGGRGLVVAASRADGTRASFSNTGSYVSLAAPGENVFGAVSQLSSPLVFPRVPLASSSSGLYGYASGTSFAAPEVAGAAALVWAANPLLRAQQVAAILELTATGNGTWNPELGWGVIDVAAAVSLAQTGAAPPLPAAPRQRRR